MSEVKFLNIPSFDQLFKIGVDINKNQLPQKYIINKNVTVLIWEDGTKTIVRKTLEDEYDKRLGFLIAYFQKHCGLSKNKANQYLASLIDEDEKKAIQIINDGELTNVLANVCDGIGESFKNIANNFRKK